MGHLATELLGGLQVCQLLPPGLLDTDPAGGRRIAGRLRVPS